MTASINNKNLTPIFLLFVIVNALFYILSSRWLLWHIHQNVVMAGNLFLFLVTLVSFFMAKKGLLNKNPHAFTRAVYGSILFKLFICMIAAFIYIAIYKKELNKAGLFICMGLYLVYTFLEVSILTRILRRKPDE